MSPNFSTYNVSQNTSKEAYEKLFGIEKRMIRKRTLLQGVLLGVLLVFLLISAFGFLLWMNQDEVAELALDYMVSGYMQDLFETFPDAYVSRNQHKIMPILDGFTNAAAAKKVTEGEFKYIGRTLILALQDRQLTYHEINDILTKMQTASKSGYNF